MENPSQSLKSVNWQEYFTKIKSQCPWSLAAWHRGSIDIQAWQGQLEPLEGWDARIYITTLNKRRVKKLAHSLDEGVYEILWSHPSYGAHATPVSVLIQQWRAELNAIRQKLLN